MATIIGNPTPDPTPQTPVVNKDKGIALIGGGTGFIGTHLSAHLTRLGFTVRHLSRQPNTSSPYATYHWDISTGAFDLAALEGVDYVINLAGAGIAEKRWTAKRKEVIIKSRTETSALLARAIADSATKPKLYLSASATGFYGDRDDELLTELSGPRAGFLSRSCLLWEASTKEVEAQGIPVFICRTGLVMHPDDGALAKMMIPLSLGTSTYFGDGQQYYSWIHIEDIIRIYSHAISENLSGIYNGVAPSPVRNKWLAEALGPAAGKKAIAVPVPAFVLKMAMGEMSHTVLDSAKVSSEKLESTGFVFMHPEISQALTDLLRGAPVTP